VARLRGCPLAQGDLDLLHEWGLGGRRFGTLITWFLIGGDCYTAYRFIAVPALAFGAGAVAFFAVPYSIFAYPLLYLFSPGCGRCARERVTSRPATSCAAASATAGSRSR
jgi:Na+/proline symporter